MTQPVINCPSCGVVLAMTADWCYGCGRIFAPHELWDLYETQEVIERH